MNMLIFVKFYFTILLYNFLLKLIVVKFDFLFKHLLKSILQFFFISLFIYFIFVLLFFETYLFDSIVLVFESIFY